MVENTGHGEAENETNMENIRTYHTAGKSKNSVKRGRSGGVKSRQTGKNVIAGATPAKYAITVIESAVGACVSSGMGVELANIDQPVGAFSEAGLIIYLPGYRSVAGSDSTRFEKRE